MSGNQDNLEHNKRVELTAKFFSFTGTSLIVTALVMPVFAHQGSSTLYACDAGLGVLGVVLVVIGDWWIGKLR